MVDSAKVRNSIRWQYLTEFMLDVIRAPEGGTQEIPNFPQVALRQFVRQRQEHQYLTASEPNHNPRGAPRSVPGRSAPKYGDSSEYPSGGYSAKPNKYPSTVPIINPTSVTSETPTKGPSHVPNRFPCAKPINMVIE